MQRYVCTVKKFGDLGDDDLRDMDLLFGEDANAEDIFYAELKRDVRKNGGDGAFSVVYGVSASPCACAFIGASDEIDMSLGAWKTLRVYVRPNHRGRGLAKFATAGLLASCGRIEFMSIATLDAGTFAVAKSVGIDTTLFSQDSSGYQKA